MNCNAYIIYICISLIFAFTVLLFTSLFPVRLLFQCCAERSVPVDLADVHRLSNLRWLLQFDLDQYSDVSEVAVEGFFFYMKCKLCNVFLHVLNDYPKSCL